MNESMTGRGWEGSALDCRRRHALAERRLATSVALEALVSHVWSDEPRGPTLMRELAMSLEFSARRTALLGVLALTSAARVASAQSHGEGFLFKKPSGSFSIHG